MPLCLIGSFAVSESSESYPLVSLRKHWDHLECFSVHILEALQNVGVCTINALGASQSLGLFTIDALEALHNLRIMYGCAEVTVKPGLAKRSY